MTVKLKLTVTSKCGWLVWRTKDLILLCLNYSRHFIFTAELPRALSCRGTTSLVQQWSTNMIFETIFEKWQNKNSGLFVSAQFLTFSCSPVPLPWSILLHSSCYMSHLEIPGVSCPQLKCQALQHTPLPASTSSAPGLLQRTSRQLRKAPKVAECFQYETEGTEILRPHLQLDISKYGGLLS